MDNGERQHIKSGHSAETDFLTCSCGSAAVGASAAFRAAPDGYTFWMGAAPHAIAPSLHPNPDYDIEKRWRLLRSNGSYFPKFKQARLKQWANSIFPLRHFAARCVSPSNSQPDMAPKVWL